MQNFKTNQKGITLIALIITIIVMLILVGVTINVALNGGLFQKAEMATKQTQLAVDREELQMAVIAALNDDREIPSAQAIKNSLSEGWQVTGNDRGPYTCTSPNGNIFTVDNKGNIEPGGNGSGGEGQEPEGNIASIQIRSTYNAINNTEVLRIIPVLYTEAEAAQMVYTDITGETDNTIEKKEDLILIIANSDNPNPFGTYDDMISAMQSSVAEDISTPEKAFAYMMKQPGIEKDYETLEEYAAAITNSGNQTLKIDGTAVGGATWEGCIAIYEATENKQYQIQIEIDGKVGTTSVSTTYISGDEIQYDKVYVGKQGQITVYCIFTNSGTRQLILPDYGNTIQENQFDFKAEEATYTVEGTPTTFKNRVFTDGRSRGPEENGKYLDGYFSNGFRTYNYLFADGGYSDENYKNLTWTTLTLDPTIDVSTILN